MVIVVLVTGAAPSQAHRFFVSLAQTELNPETQRLEVALRLDEHNLEDALRFLLGDDYRLQPDAASETAIRRYIEDNFTLQTSGGDPSKLYWLGWEYTQGPIWVYFEILVPGDDHDMRMRNTLFFEVADEQVNTVKIKDATGTRTLTFTRSNPEAPFARQHRQQVEAH
jgi:hypothetical protein